MPESSLSVAYTDLTQDTGIWLGFGSGTGSDPTWSSFQSERVLHCVKLGLRQFYWPPPVPPDDASYDWSFLKPVGTVTLQSDASEVPLPDDFGGFEGQITMQSTTGTTRGWWPVRLDLEGRVRMELARLPTTTGPPQLAGLTWVKGTSLNEGQRAKLVIWPLADTAYTLQFQYYLLPDMISGTAPYVYGGAAHAETVLASCKYAAERDYDDIANGPQKQYYFERLAASIGADRKFKAQVAGGYNADRSDYRFNRNHPGAFFHGWNYGGIRYEGTQY